MSINRHSLVDVICEDIDGSPFNGMVAICSIAQIEYLNKDAEQTGLTRRWYTAEEYNKRKESK